MTADRPLPWELDLGVVPSGDGRARARVWAPAASTVAVRLGSVDHPMTPVDLGGAPMGGRTDQAGSPIAVEPPTEPATSNVDALT